MQAMQDFMFVDKYARYVPELGRRETWDEAVERVLAFFQKVTPEGAVPASVWAELRLAMQQRDVLPSMRVLQMAGPTLDRCHVGAYNCSYLPLRDWRAFGELLYILMQGTGVGFSCEGIEVDQLPALLPMVEGASPVAVAIPDTTEGWCDSVVTLLTKYALGIPVTFDYSQIRPKGAVLKTKGGRASGPEPLRQLHANITRIIDARRGGFLRPIDAHDIACCCGQIVEMGGVRRSALISLSDVSDSGIRDAKTGEFWLTAPHRSQANNSAVYTTALDPRTFDAEWNALVASGTGERGIFNRYGLKHQLPHRRQWRDDLGTNPCGEIVLRPFEFCNLSIAVAREGDTEADLVQKVMLASVFGTLQAQLVKFNYLRPEWAANCKEERLLGVDITGQMDCEVLRPDGIARAQTLRTLQACARKTNEWLAQRLGIPISAAVTCVKPSGNSAQLLGCSSGIHPRFAPFYIRRVRVSADSPIARYMREQGVPFAPEVGQTPETMTTAVFEFPMRSPKGAVCKGDMSALAQLENWLTWKQCFTEHNPSATIYVKQGEWGKVKDWVQMHFHLIGGLSFLPDDGGVYALAPYEEISADTYAQRSAAFPALDFTQVQESVDVTDLGREFACMGGSCEL